MHGNSMKHQCRLHFHAARAIAVMVATAFLAAHSAIGAEWKPDKRVEIAVPSGPGGGNDRIARVIQKIMQDRRLTDVVTTIVNKPGAGQVLGLVYLSQQPPDGQHMAITSVGFLTNYITGRTTVGPNDVVPLALLFAEYIGFAVHPDSILKTGKDVLAALKADAGSVSASMSGGAGNHNYLALGTVTRAVGGDVKKLKTVIYPSGNAAMMAMLGRHVDFVVAPAATLLPQLASGQLRMIAITAPKRLEGAFAGVPTWVEQGANAVVSNWRVMVAPRGTSPPQTAFWDNVFAQIVETAEWKKMLEEDVVTSHFLRSAEARAYLNAQYDELKKLLTDFAMVKQ